MLPKLMKYLSTRHNYSVASKYIPRESLPKEAAEYFDHLKVYFDTVDITVAEVDKSAFLLSYYLDHPHDELFDMFVDTVDEAHTEDSSIVQKLIDKVAAADIALICDDIINSVGKATVASVDKRIQEYTYESVKLDRELQAEESKSLLDSLKSIERTGYTWPLKFLGNILGPLNKELIIVGAYVEGGKTTFMVQCAWYIAKQMSGDDKVLWFNNEESIDKVKQRFVQSALGRKKDDLLDNPVQAIIDLKKVVDLENRVVFIDDANNIHKIQREITRHKPKLIIVDQLYKVSGSMRSKEGNEAERYRGLCEWARNIAKHTCPVLVSSQLDYLSVGMKYPGMEHLYMSKTGAQGEADAIIMIGSIPSEPNMRYIHTPKNKLTGKTTKHEVFILKDIARFRDV